MTGGESAQEKAKGIAFDAQLAARKEAHGRIIPVDLQALVSLIASALEREREDARASEQTACSAWGCARCTTAIRLRPTPEAPEAAAPPRRIQSYDGREHSCDGPDCNCRGTGR